jgi:hypothetical protein
MTTRPYDIIRATADPDQYDVLVSTHTAAAARDWVARMSRTILHVRRTATAILILVR